jgi:acid phosphatase
MKNNENTMILSRFSMLFSTCIFTLVSAAFPVVSKANDSTKDLKNIKTVVVIYAENRSFDNLYGLFPGANGVLKNADGSSTDFGSFKQRDRDGITLLPNLPSVWNAIGTPSESKMKFVSTLPNAPFRIDAPPGGMPGVGAETATPDLVNRFYNNLMQINYGKNDMFAAWSDAGGLTMGYYDGSVMTMWAIAQEYTLADNFFMGAFGGSFINHFWLVCACTPTYPNPPVSLISQTEANGIKLSENSDSPHSALLGKPIFTADKPLSYDSFAINTAQPTYQPSGIAPNKDDNPLISDKSKNPLPPQDSNLIKTIGDQLTEKSIPWIWYAGGYKAALLDRGVIYNNKNINFQPHHQPFNYFSRFDPSTPNGAKERKEHFKDLSDLENDISSGTLPPVSFYKPQGNLNQHPGYTDVLSGDEHIASLIEKLRKGPQWKDMAVILTYDENGGFWDHISPPKGDRWGPGTRVPTIIISPYAKKHYVDHTAYDTTSIIKFITKRFDLTPLPGVRASSGDLTNAFEFE